MMIAMRTSGAVLSMTVADTALACGACVTATADSVLPPTRVWCLFAVCWFIAHGAISSRARVSLHYQPRFFASIGVVLAAAFAAAAWLGPLALFPLALPPAYAVARAFVPRADLDETTRKLLRWSGAVAVLAVGSLGIWSAHEIRTRTEAEIIAEWSATATGRARFNALRAKEPASLVTYRELLRIGDETVAVQSAERIAVVGDPEIDLPLLTQALERFGANDGAADRIVLAIRQLRARRSASHGP